MVDIGGTGVEQPLARNVRCQQRIKCRHAAGQCQTAGAVASGSDAGRQVQCRQRAAAHAERELDIGAEGGRLGVAEHNAVQLGTHIFRHHVVARRQLHGGLLVDRGNPDFRAGDGQVETALQGGSLVGVPVVSCCIDRRIAGRHVVSWATVGDHACAAVLVGRAGRVEAVIGYHLQYEFGVEVSTGADRQGGQRTVDICHRAGQLQITIGDAGAAAIGGHAAHAVHLQRDIARHIGPDHGLAVAVDHAHDHGNLVDFAGIERFEIRVAQHEARCLVVGGNPVDQDRCARFAGKHRRIIAWLELDLENRWRQIDAGVADGVVAVADQVLERIGMRFAAVVLVRDQACVQVGLGKYRAYLERHAVLQELAVLGCFGNTELDLDGAVVGVGIGQLAVRWLRTARYGSAVNGRRAAFRQRMDIGQIILAGKYRCIVFGGNGDPDDHIGPHTGLVGGARRCQVATVGTHILVVDRTNGEAVGKHFVAIVLVDQFARVQIGLGNAVMQCYCGARATCVEQIQRTGGRQAGHLQPERILVGVASLAGNGPVTVGQHNVTQAIVVDDHRSAFEHIDFIALRRGGGVVLRRGPDREGVERIGCGIAVGHRKPELVGELLVAGMLEHHQAGVYIGLGERAELAQCTAVEVERAAGGQFFKPVGDLVGRADAVAGAQIGCRQGVAGAVAAGARAFKQGEIPVAGNDQAGGGIGQWRQGAARSWLDGRHLDAEGKLRQRRIGQVAVVNAAIALGNRVVAEQQAGGAVLDGKREAVGADLCAAGAQMVGNLAILEILHRKRRICVQQLAVEREVTAGGIGLLDIEDQVVVKRV